MMSDYIFAFFHLFLILGAVVYAVYSLLIGNTLRFVFMIAVLGIYYWAVLHKPVKIEIARRRGLKNQGEKK
ncbi:MAG: hypothetical protein GQ544_09260 [Candidatus Aminicenantes bacterium]|nr:hypothetical protein [Candidatus Aminicenantes bacterium]